MGNDDGVALGSIDNVGTSVGPELGPNDMVGDSVGRALGPELGSTVGKTVGGVLGATVLGNDDGVALGSIDNVGTLVGPELGANDMVGASVTKGETNATLLTGAPVGFMDGEDNCDKSGLGSSTTATVAVVFVVFVKGISLVQPPLQL